MQRCALRCLCAALPVLLVACTHAVKVPLTPVTVALPSLSAPAPPSRDAALKQLQAMTPCCTGWPELPYHRTLPAEPEDFVFDRFSPAADLDGQRTHFLSFALSVYKQSYRVLFKAQPSARHLQSSYLFAPTITLLDEHFKPLRSEDLKLCEYLGWRPALSGAFGSFTVDDKRAKYLVITASPAQLKATTYWEQSPAGFTADVAPDPASRGNFSIPHGPDGALSFGLLTPQYEGAVKNGLCGKPKKSAGLLPQSQLSIAALLH